MTTPNNEPQVDAIPPANDVPPITAPAIAFVSCPAPKPAVIDV